MTTLAKGDHARSAEALLKLKEIARSLRDKLVELFEEKSAIEDTEDDDVDEDKREQTEHAISLCLRRLAVMSSRWPLASLLARTHLSAFIFAISS